MSTCHSWLLWRPSEPTGESIKKMRNQINHILKHKLEGDKTHKSSSFSTKWNMLLFLITASSGSPCFGWYQLALEGGGSHHLPHFTDQNSEAWRRVSQIHQHTWRELDTEAHFLSTYPVFFLSRTWLLQNYFIYGKDASFCSLLLNSKLMRSMFLKMPKANKLGKGASVMNLLWDICRGVKVHVVVK